MLTVTVWQINPKHTRVTVLEAEDLGQGSVSLVMKSIAGIFSHFLVYVLDGLAQGIGIKVHKLGHVWTICRQRLSLSC